MKIGDEVFVHGYVDEIRKDCIIIRNDGGYFGTLPSECYAYEEDALGYGTMNEAEQTEPQIDKDINVRSKTEPQTDYDKGLQQLREIMFDKEKTEQLIKECEAMGIKTDDCQWR